MGQFDDVIDPESGVTLTPDPQLDPFAMPPQATATPIPTHPAMAMPTPPTSPQAPAPPGNLQRIISSALLGLAAGLGPQHGGAGVAAGLAQGAHANEQARQTKYENDLRLYHEQQQEAIRQQTVQTAQQHAEDQRQQQLQKALFDISAQVKTIPTKDEYDQRVQGYANILRMDPNKLRTMIPPFVAPTSKKLAQDAVANLFKNPLMQEQIKNNPQAVATGSIMVDLNNDGVPEKRTIQEVMDAAGMAMMVDDKGKPVGFSPATDGPVANLALKASLAAFRTDNRRDPTAKEMQSLIADARKTPKEPKDPEMAALAKQGAELSNSIKKNQLDQQPTPEQIDMYAGLLADHKMSPSQIQIQAGGMGQQGRAFLRQVQAAAVKRDPNFNFEEAEATYQLVKSPTFQNTVRYMDSVVESMPRVQATAAKLANGRVRGINALINAGKNQYNDVDLKKFKTDVLFVSDEIAKILQGGGTGSGTSDAKLRQASEILSTNDSPQAIAGALGEAAALMQNRRSSLTRGTYLDQPVEDAATRARRKLDQQ